MVADSIYVIIVIQQRWLSRYDIPVIAIHAIDLSQRFIHFQLVHF